MSLHDIVKTTIKMTGLVLVLLGAVRASSWLATVIESFSYGDFGPTVLNLFGAIISPILFGAFLWLFPTRVANSIVDIPAADDQRDEWLLGLERLGIRLLGLALLYFAVSELVSGYAMYLSAMEALGQGNQFSGAFRARVGMWVNGLEILMALGLILGASGITNLVQGLRYGGRHELARNQPHDSG